MRSKNYIKFRGYYRSGAWTKEQLHNVVGRPTGITQAEYEEITGEAYASPEG